MPLYGSKDLKHQVYTVSILGSAYFENMLCIWVFGSSRKYLRHKRGPSFCGGLVEEIVMGIFEYNRESPSWLKSLPRNASTELAEL